jgi:hypothetical protein
MTFPRVDDLPGSCRTTSRGPKSRRSGSPTVMSSSAERKLFGETDACLGPRPIYLRRRGYTRLATCWKLSSGREQWPSSSGHRPHRRLAAAGLRVEIDRGVGSRITRSRGERGESEHFSSIFSLQRGDHPISETVETVLRRHVAGDRGLVGGWYRERRKFVSEWGCRFHGLLEYRRSFRVVARPYDPRHFVLKGGNCLVFALADGVEFGDELFVGRRTGRARLGSAGRRGTAAACEDESRCADQRGPRD